MRLSLGLVDSFEMHYEFLHVEICMLELLCDGSVIVCVPQNGLQRSELGESVIFKLLSLVIVLTNWLQFLRALDNGVNIQRLNHGDHRVLRNRLSACFINVHLLSLTELDC